MSILLAIQEYDFKIVYHKCSSNSNADALSRLPNESCAVTIGLPHYSPTELHASQSNDDTLSAVHQARLSSPDTPQTTRWNKHPFHRYKQLWHQLRVVDSVLCRQYTPSPMHQAVMVPILPPDLQKDALIRSHDAPTAGHLGAEKTLVMMHYGLIWPKMLRSTADNVPPANS